jgi:hypothetical protein
MSFSATHTASHDDAMDFPEALGPRDSTFEERPEPKREHIMAEQQSEERAFDRALEDHAFEDRSFAEPAAATQTFEHESHRSGEVISLEAMRGMAPNFEQDDLDVPAFMRKRNEVM